MSNTMPDQYDPPSTEQTPPTLGSLIKARRQSQGLTYGQLAELVGTTKSTIHAWEHDQMVPKARSLVTLARVLELSTGELKALGVDLVHDAPSLTAMLRADYDLPPEAIEQIERYVSRVAKKYSTTKQRSSSEQERRNS